MVFINASRFRSYITATARVRDVFLFCHIWRLVSRSRHIATVRPAPTLLSWSTIPLRPTAHTSASPYRTPSLWHMFRATRESSKSNDHDLSHRCLETTLPLRARNTHDSTSVYNTYSIRSQFNRGGGADGPPSWHHSLRNTPSNSDGYEVNS